MSAEASGAEGPPEGLLRDAASHATRSVPTASPRERAGELRERLVGTEYACAADVVVLDRGEPVGVIPIERVLSSASERPVETIMDPAPPLIGPETHQARAAHEMVAMGERGLAVVNGAGEFMGWIAPERMLSVLLAEHDEDLARLGGYVAGADRARSAAEERVARRLWHRLPWLMVGVLGAMISALLVGAFEERLAANVLIAFFVPAIVYMADAVGTQTETVLIRGLAAGITPASVLRRELVTGLITGLLIGAVFFAFAMIGWGDAEVAAAVAVALFASCSIATVVAIVLPTIFQRVGIDPAFGSGPLATVIQDLLSILVYFAVVVAIVG